MEKENRKGLIYEFPMGVAVLKGGNSLQIDIANAEFMKAIGHGEQAEPDRNRDFYDCVYLQDAGAFEDMIEKCREQKRAEEIEVRIISGQGQICWVKFWCSIYYYKDAVPYYLLICKNTNDRKELEDELLFFLLYMPLPTYLPGVSLTGWVPKKVISGLSLYGRWGPVCMHFAVGQPNRHWVYTMQEK